MTGHEPVQGQGPRRHGSIEETQRGGIRYFAAVSLLGLVVIASLPVPLASARAQTCSVEDPIGDTHWVGSDQVLPAYEDLVLAEIAKKDKDFVYRMKLAAPLPTAPSFPVATTTIFWAWRLDTDPDTFPQGGFPYGAAAPHFEEFFVALMWDGVAFTGIFVDRRPLLSGGVEILIVLPFLIQGEKIEMSTSAAAIGDPASFAWLPGPINFFVLGTEGWLLGEFATMGTWPC